jgi:ABC-type branched-subunit amino acid transport system ATPase component
VTLGVTDLYGDQAFDVELRAVTKRFGPLTAVNAVTLKVHKGEFLALLGPSGCGKTTSLRLIVGFEQPDEGKIPDRWQGRGRCPAVQARRQHRSSTTCCSRTGLDAALGAAIAGADYGR